MSTTPKIPELDYLPTRGGVDQGHDHSSYRPTDAERENCAGCAQTINDFTWIRFHDAVAGRRDEFGTPELAVAAVLAERTAERSTAAA